MTRCDVKRLRHYRVKLQHVANQSTSLQRLCAASSWRICHQKPVVLLSHTPVFWFFSLPSRSPDSSSSPSSSASSSPSCAELLLLPPSSSVLLRRSWRRPLRLAELHPGLQQGQTEEGRDHRPQQAHHLTPPASVTRPRLGNCHYGNMTDPLVLHCGPDRFTLSLLEMWKGITNTHTLKKNPSTVLVFIAFSAFKF